MEIIDLFIILSTVILLCSWSFLAWSLYTGNTNFKKFPPYGVPTCPFLYNYDKDIGQCSLNNKAFEAHQGEGTPAIKATYLKQVGPYDRKLPCMTHNELNTISSPTLSWDGLRYGDDAPNEYKECCNADTVADNEKCTRFFSDEPMEIDFGYGNGLGRRWSSSKIGTGRNGLYRTRRH